MKFVLVGLNHHTAPIAVRERFAFSKHYLPEALNLFVDGQNIVEGMILSTCNRVELLGVTPHEGAEGVNCVKSFLKAIHQKCDGYDEHLYHYTDQEVARHVFRVASSLDSMILGEPQILGQVKDAYATAQALNKTGTFLNKLMHKAFSVAKRVRTETRIGANAISISYAAVELARRIFTNLEGQTVLLVGAGEMAELAATHLMSAGASHIVVASRSYEKAVQLATKFNGSAVIFDRFRERLPEADILIFATAAPHFVVRVADVASAMERRRHRPMFIIDISVPRNVDPAINDLEQVFVYDVDDLQSVVESNLRERKLEAERAHRIIEEELAAFLAEWRAMSAAPFIAALNAHLAELAQAEYERHRKRIERLGGMSPEVERYVREVIITSILRKFAHPLIENIRESAAQGEQSRLCETFGLEVRIGDFQSRARLARSA
ncbi:MAG: glutamyl-tRNA reductase [Chloracidobacterium sp. CP2_5A]|nr:MAG: glutamyl-tRNA reductase [Chloracidobacterium sp. CP2_5A]